VTHRERYQDTSEHVSSPNREPSMKDGYQCMNEYCIANNLRCTWINDGEIFIHQPNGIKWTVAHNVIKKCSVSGQYYALDSWMHYYESGKEAIRRRKIRLNIFNRRIEIEPKEKGYKYSEDQRYNPSLWRYKFTFWKKTEDHSYTLIVPDVQMIKFSIRQFKNYYSRVIEGDEGYSLEKCFEYLFGKENQKEKRYEKISRWIFSIFYGKEKRTVLHLYQMKFAKRELI
jgi:hypothetical protein